jgi:hypothetical protein
VGGDAVINVKRWRQPSGMSWSSPHGVGDIVKIEDPENLKLGAMAGRWL